MLRQPGMADKRDDALPKFFVSALSDLKSLERYHWQGHKVKNSSRLNQGRSFFAYFQPPLTRLVHHSTSSIATLVVFIALGFDIVEEVTDCLIIVRC
jgi:hypothetical protein